MFWSKARKIRELESNLDAMDKLIGSIKIQRDAFETEANKCQRQIIPALVAERDQLHRKVEELQVQLTTHEQVLGDKDIRIRELENSRG